MKTRDLRRAEYKSPRPSADALHGTRDVETLEALSKIGAEFVLWDATMLKWKSRDPTYIQNHMFAGAGWYKLKGD